MFREEKLCNGYSKFDVPNCKFHGGKSSNSGTLWNLRRSPNIRVSAATEQWCQINDQPFLLHECVYCLDQVREFSNQVTLFGHKEVFDFAERSSNHQRRSDRSSMLSLLMMSITFGAKLESIFRKSFLLLREIILIEI